MQKKRTDKILREDEAKYYQRMKTRLTQKGAHQIPYKAVKQLKGGETPPHWEVHDIDPELTDQQTADKLADFFNAISSKFEPLSAEDVPSSWNKEYPLLQPHEGSQRIKQAKKPKSMVSGDLFPQLVHKYSDLIAIPLTKIYNLITWTYAWPTQWKIETVTVIPKGQNANSYEECRNLLCTPLFSKICESYLMDRINSEVRVDLSQFGGTKKCGTEHLLLQSRDNILTGLEDNRGSVNLITIDFSKAFNRMKHQACIKAFHRKGASNQTLNLIAAFLSGRQMAEKMNGQLSSLRPNNGGSPQGCVSANSLFCATIKDQQEGNIEESYGTENLALLPRSDGSSMYAGETILNDCVSFEENGTDLGPVSPLWVRYPPLKASTHAPLVRRMIIGLISPVMWGTSPPYPTPSRTRTLKPASRLVLTARAGSSTRSHSPRNVSEIRS